MIQPEQRAQQALFGVTLQSCPESGEGSGLLLPKPCFTVNSCHINKWIKLSIQMSVLREVALQPEGSLLCQGSQPSSGPGGVFP